MTDRPSTKDAGGAKPATEGGGLWGLLPSTAGLLLTPLGLLCAIRATTERLPLPPNVCLLLASLGLPLAILGIIVGRRAHRAAKVGGRRAPGAVASTIHGCIGVALSLFLISGLALIWNEYADWTDCSFWSQVKTSSVTQVHCDDEFRERLSERFNVPPGSVPALRNL